MNEVDEIKRRIDIVDYISTYVRLTKRGKNWLGLCPFHGEKTPSFNVSREPAIFKCFGCGEGGDIFKFVMKTDGLSFREALERLAERAGVKLEDRAQSGPTADKKERARAMYAEAARFFAAALWNTPDALDYARRRGLSDAALRDFGVGWAPNEWNALSGYLGRIGWNERDLYEAGLVKASERGSFYDAFRGRLMFPIFDLQNRVIAFGGRIVGEGEPKYLNSAESPIFFKAGTLYAMNFAHKAIAEQDRVLVMEGYMDVIAAHQAGFPIAVATLGTSLTADHVSLLARRTKRVILAYDADSAGVKAALRGGPMFEQAEMDVRLLTLPDGHDPDSFLRAHGAPAFAERLDSAAPLLDFQLRQLRFQFDMDSPDGRTEYVKAAMPVLAGVRSNVTRDRYVRQLAEVWAQGDMGRVAYREEDIRRDLAVMGRRLLAEQRAKWRQRPESDAPALTGAITPEAGPNRSLAEMAAQPEPAADRATPSGVGIAEREVLRALLQEPELARPLHLRTEEFTEGLHRQIAELALGRMESPGGASLLDNVAAMPEPMARLVTQLTLTENPPVTSELVSDAVERVRIHARQRRLSELADYIQPRIAEGRLSKDDPLWQEWQSLQRQSRVSDRSRVG